MTMTATKIEVRPLSPVLGAEITGVDLREAPDAATLAKLQKAIAGLNQAKLTKATQHIATWLRKNCGA